ncbi:transporter substrate-binding domain-containing protein [Paucibacter sp. APW11]|uniref:Transporter substrate-binding domain-containing protein n=1 Tax=Roseateles aquae TaxID=3077235 RepID=A0ABU3PGB2_9BURK|nr:transporter substrate-binding domain-containing protein [Paucibacter sp. APW11]MDT9001639.1 transporter substrate-binding domain-containing protein [Paucibacter sp. APW11]
MRIRSLGSVMGRRLAAAGLFTGLLLNLPPACAAPPLPEDVRVCDDANEWPPFSYYERIGGQPGKRLQGFSVELLQTIFQRHQIRHTIELLPWKRCLQEVREGQRFQMLMSATVNAERRRDYLLSEPYYTTLAHYFYLKSRFPQGLQLSSSAELGRYVLGGIRGYAYPRVPAELRERMQRTGSYPALFGMLRLGRVDLLVEGLEPMLGLAKTGVLQLQDDPDLAWAPLPGATPEPFYMLFTAQQPAGTALQALVNDELRQMQHSGELQKLLARHLPAATR